MIIYYSNLFLILFLSLFICLQIIFYFYFCYIFLNGPLNYYLLFVIRKDALLEYAPKIYKQNLKAS